MSLYKKREQGGASEPREGLRMVLKLSTNPLQCPICDITLRPETIATHYEQELERVRAPLSQKKRKRHSEERDNLRDRGSVATNSRRHSSDSQPLSLVDRAKTELDSVRRRQFLFEHNQTLPPSHDQPGPSHQPSVSSCPVCGVRLSSIEEEAYFHVDSCLRDHEDGSSNGSDEYEEYTWCNETRVRATSMLSAETRANLFGGTIISRTTDTSVDDVIDVEEDDTSMFGPAQYLVQQFNETHIQDCNLPKDSGETPTSPQSPPHKEPVSDESTRSADKPLDTVARLPVSDEMSPITNTSSQSGYIPIQCLICMGNYIDPVVSVRCWHVYCEQCWLQALKAQKLCPKCKLITCAVDLRRIFL